MVRWVCARKCPGSEARSPWMSRWSDPPILARSPPHRNQMSPQCLASKPCLWGEEKRKSNTLDVLLTHGIVVKVKCSNYRIRMYKLSAHLHHITHKSTQTHPQTITYFIFIVVVHWISPINRECGLDLHWSLSVACSCSCSCSWVKSSSSSFFISAVKSATSSTVQKLLVQVALVEKSNEKTEKSNIKSNRFPL